MAAVTQLISTYTGGVSTQPDVKKLSGQVREADNCFADPTFGMTKRSGSLYLASLDDTPALKDGKWFFILRDNREAYIGCIVNGNIRIWNAITTVEASVDVSAGSTYITNTSTESNRHIFDVLTIQDTSIITNKNTVVAAQAIPSWTSGKNATVRLLEVSYGAEYVIDINGTEAARYDSPPNADSSTINANTILDDLKSDLEGKGYTVTKLDSSLEITSDTAFEINSRGGIGNDALLSFQDTLEVASLLPNQSIDGRLVKIINTDTDGLGYWTEFTADDGVSGNGFWEETVAPNVSPGFDNSTMPHQLKATAPNTFVLEPIPYEGRLVGDDETNPQPSFVGEKIQKSFFNSNRLGFLSEANVIMSQSGDPYNFYSASAQQQISSDVIDLNASSTRPVLLFSILNVAQGLLMFSRRQQFLLFSEDGALSPSTAVIRQISEYEMNTLVEPVNTGNSITFTSKSPSQSRVYSMVTRGSEDSPLVADIGKVVSGYLPDSIDFIESSPQNELTIFSGNTDKSLYFYRTYSNGQQIVLQSWFKWTMPGELQTFFAVEDRLFTVCAAGGHYLLSVVYFNQVQETEIIVNESGSIAGNPALEFYTKPSSIVLDGDNSKIYLPFTLPSQPATLLVTSSRTTFRRVNFDQFGYDDIASYNPNDDAGYIVKVDSWGEDGGGKYAVVNNQDLTGYATHCVVGYDYTMSLELPEFYYKMDGNDKVSDFTASLTISRLKFSIGLSGAISFKINAKGSDEWTDTQPVIEANYYLSNDSPLADENIFILPVYQRSKNFLVKAESDFPFPVSINSMMWEGQYSPRYYRRV